MAAYFLSVIACYQFELSTARMKDNRIESACKCTNVITAMCVSRADVNFVKNFSITYYYRRGERIFLICPFAIFLQCRSLNRSLRSLMHLYFMTENSNVQLWELFERSLWSLVVEFSRAISTSYFNFDLTIKVSILLLDVYVICTYRERIIDIERLEFIFISGNINTVKLILVFRYEFLISNIVHTLNR